MTAMAGKTFLVALLALLILDVASAVPSNLNVTIAGGAAYTASSAVTLALYADNTTAGTNCSLSNDNSAWSPVPFVSSPSPASWNLTSGDGAKSVYFRCTDDGENWSAVASGSIILDTAPPAIGSFSPGNGTVIGNPRPAISASLSDSGSGINSSSIVMKLDGSLVSATYSSGTALYSPASDLSEATHGAEITIYDNAGHSAYANWTFTIDKAPAIGSISPADGSFLSTGSFAISAAISDSGSGLNTSATVFYVDGVDVTANSTYSSSTISYPVALGEGNHSAQLTVRDLSGNQVSENWSFIVDKSEPSVGSLSPADGTEVTNVTSISASITDSLSGIKASSLKMKVDAQDVTPDTEYTSGIFSFIPGRMAGGNHTVEIYADDRAGNSAYASWTFSVFSKAPVMGSLSPSEGSAMNGTRPPISAMVTDSGISGLDLSSLRIYLDGLDVSSHASYDNSSRVISYAPQTDLSEGNHTAKVAISDNLGNAAERSWLFTIDLTAPQPPSGLSVSPLGGGTMALSWQASPDAASYRIYRSASASKSLSDFSLLTTIPAPNYTDPGAPAKSYYAVTAVDSAGNEGLPAFAASCASYGATGWEDYACCNDSDCGGAICNTSSHSCYTPLGYVSKKDAETEIQDVQGQLLAAESAGKNVTEAEALLNQSRDSLNSGNYSMAMQLADQALFSLQNAPDLNQTQAQAAAQKTPLPGCGSGFVLLGIMAAAFLKKED